MSQAKSTTNTSGQQKTYPVIGLIGENQNRNQRMLVKFDKGFLQKPMTSVDVRAQ